MKKIIYLVPEIYNCGPLNVVLNILRFLNLDIFDPYIVALRRSSHNQDYLKEFIDIVGMEKIYYLDGGNSPLDDLLKIVLDRKIDCIHSHGFYPDKLASKISGLKKISTVHCMFYKDYPKEYGAIKGLIGAYMHFSILKKSKINHIVGCSNAVSNYCKHHLKDLNITTINNGVDQNVFYKLDEMSRLKLKEKYNISNKRVFVYSGRFIRRKKVPELIQIFIENSTERDVLLLLGDGPEKELCERKYTQENIQFLGQVSNPEKFYQVSDFIISNSDSEGYPMSIIEAVSCGCYALLSDIPPHREFIEKNLESSNLINSSNFSLVTRQTANFNTVKLSAKMMSEQYMSLYLD
ncbi:glycosyltransferase family 4 protein [Acinetobacter sp. YH12043]|uniref:glycosyltransferase family 4 protein n=1 Tax=Acinetobacter sp. YH12043 TaxID=2601050 RepID=UPI0015D13E54|nr:glycosyltransferase family 4 protein [Acinetobacter sp. YH12043]